MKSEQEKTYKITDYVSKEFELTKDQYISHLLTKLRYAYRDLQEEKLKELKAQNNTKKVAKDLDKVVSELQELDPTNISKHLDYEKWAFQETSPKKYKILKDNKCL